MGCVGKDHVFGGLRGEGCLTESGMDKCMGQRGICKGVASVERCC